MTEYDIYVPLTANTISKTAVQHKLVPLKKKLTKEFGGLTYFPQENEGLWRFGRVTFRDKIVILRVLSSRKSQAEQFLKKIKRRIKRELKQSDVLIIARKVRIL